MNKAQTEVDRLSAELSANHTKLVGALSVHHLAAIGVAIRETIQAGDPDVPRASTGTPLWSPHWQFYNSQIATQQLDSFVAEVTRRLAEKAK